MYSKEVLAIAEQKMREHIALITEENCDPDGRAYDIGVLADAIVDYLSEDSIANENELKLALSGFSIGYTLANYGLTPAEWIKGILISNTDLMKLSDKFNELSEFHWTKDEATAAALARDISNALISYMREVEGNNNMEKYIKGPAPIRACH